MTKVLITGMSGFIGHHVAEGILKNTDWEVVGLDRYSTSGTQSRIMDIDQWPRFSSRVSMIWHDLRSPINEFHANCLRGKDQNGFGSDIDYIFHLAASSHVDRSIEDPLSFVYDNIVGTCNLLNYARTLPKLKQLIYFSTDEVFGPAPKDVLYKEWDRYKSGNPYAATKAGGEELAIAFQNTYQLPIIVTHTMNVFGERQHKEKFIPTIIRNILINAKLMIHADKECKNSGTRFYIHARNVAAALLFLTQHGTPGEKYNIVGEREVSNLDLALFIEKVVKENHNANAKLNYELTDFHSSRPGHDLRYSLDGTLMHDMGFRYPKTFEDSMTKTIQWSLQHLNWIGVEHLKFQPLTIPIAKPDTKPNAYGAT